MKPTRKLKEENNIEPILEAGIALQKQSSDEIVRNLEHLIVQGEEHNPEPILEAQLIALDKINKNIEKVTEDKSQAIEDGAVITIKGLKGNKGDKGDTPTKEQLVSIIKPLIPKPIKGKDGKDADHEAIVRDVVGTLASEIPTAKEVADFLPKPENGKDGKDADEGKIIKTVLSKIPKPKNGKNGKDGTLVSGPELISKMKDLPKGSRLSFDWLDDAPVFKHSSSKTVSLVELDDVDYSGLSYVNGKYVLGSGSSGSVWGSITGTLSAQTDLQTALNAKQNTITTGTSAQYFRGDLSLATFPTLVSTFTNDAGYLTTISGGDHNTLSNLTTGDVHTQYALLAGRATPQTIALGTLSGASTGYITSTFHSTKGKYFLNAAGTIAVDELNARLGIGIATPTQKLHVVGTGYVSSFFGVGAIASGSYNFEVTGSSNFSSTTYFRGITYHFNGTNNYFGMQAISTTNKIFTTSGTTNKDIVIQNGDVTTALFNNASSIATVTIGTAGATLGQLALTGNTSGTITIKGQAAAGSYNFNLPTSAGSSGQPLLSGGGASAAMTFGTLGVNAGGTGATSMTTNGIAYGSATMSYTSSSNNAVLVTSGTGTPSLSSVLPDSLTLLGVTFQDTGKNITFGSSIGTKIGTATNQKLAFYNSNPIVQPANTVAIDTLLSNLGLRATGGSANFALKITNALPQTLKAYTVATLPAGVVGDMAYVTDALAPTYLTALTGGGAITVSCFYNGTAWVAS